MPAAPIPELDEQRLCALERYKILDTASEEIFDRITTMAKALLRTPIALISLIDRDRQWFKSHLGLAAQETPRDQAFCGYALLQSDVLVVEDATIDPRFSDNPLVLGEPRIRFYAGAQLITHDNYIIGTLCIIDLEPRKLAEVDIILLKELAKLAMNEIELRNVNASESIINRYENRDLLTNEYNKNTFERLYEAECARAHCHKLPLSLAIIQIEGIENISELFGISVCDTLINSYSIVFRYITRPGDILARVGKNKFCLLMPKTKNQSAEILVRRIISRVTSGRSEIGINHFSCSVSIGLADLGRNQKSMDLYKEVEKNRYTAANIGANEYVSSYAA